MRHSALNKEVWPSAHFPSPKWWVDIKQKWSQSLIISTLLTTISPSNKSDFFKITRCKSEKILQVQEQTAAIIISRPMQGLPIAGIWWKKTINRDRQHTIIQLQVCFSIGRSKADGISSNEKLVYPISQLWMVLMIFPRKCARWPLKRSQEPLKVRFHC